MNEKEELKKGTGQRIKSIRLEEGLTMKEFGARLNPPAADSIVSRWERGVSLPNGKRLRQIAEMGNMSVLFLTTGVKAIADLNEEDYVELAQSNVNKANEQKYLMEQGVRADLNYYANSTLEYIEIMFFLQTFNYFKYSKAEDIKFMVALFGQLNKYKDYAANEEVEQDELLEFIEGETKDFKEFLKRRYGYEGD